MHKVTAFAVKASDAASRIPTAYSRRLYHIRNGSREQKAYGVRDTTQKGPSLYGRDPFFDRLVPDWRHFVTLRPFTPAAVAALAFAFSCGRSARTASPAFHISLSCIAWSLAAMNSL